MREEAVALEREHHSQMAALVVVGQEIPLEQQALMEPPTQVGVEVEALVAVALVQAAQAALES
jgi:hypothetical protein